MKNGIYDFKTLADEYALLIEEIVKAGSVSAVKRGKLAEFAELFKANACYHLTEVSLKASAEGATALQIPMYEGPLLENNPYVKEEKPVSRVNAHKPTPPAVERKSDSHGGPTTLGGEQVEFDAFGDPL